MTLQDDVAREARMMDERFDRSQSELVAKFRQAGAGEDEIPELLGQYHTRYWAERNARLDELAELLAEVARLTDALGRRDRPMGSP